MGLLVVFLLNMTKHAVVPQVLRVGGILERLVIVAYGFLELLLVDARQTAQLVEVDDVRVTVDGLRTVGFGTCEVVQVILGNGTEEPWLVEVWLGGNGLIKILDA